MRIARLVFVVLMLLPASAYGQEREPVVDGMVVVRLHTQPFLGKYARTTGIASLDALLEDLRVLNISPMLSQQMLGKRTLQTSALDGVIKIQYDADVSPRRVALQLAADPTTVYAEPLFQHKISIAPDDVDYPSMSQFSVVEAEMAWDVVKGDSGSVVIAVVDGGTDWNHIDLLDNVWINPTEIPDNASDDDENGFVDDVHGWNFPLGSNDPTGIFQQPQNSSHGTHVAGTAAAVTNNGTGISSLSWNAVLMPINAASRQSDDNISFGYDGITYAAANGADIINCSWGRSGGGSRFEQDVIDFAFDNGALIVAAAGNESNNSDAIAHFPASYDRVLSVGATGSGTTNTDQVGSFSNYGVSVDVYAPGISILSTTPGNNYSPFFTGTSMASPMAAALASLVKTISPALSVDELREQIRITSDNIDSVNPTRAGFLGRGRINAHRAVTEFNSPSVRILTTTILESVPDGVISPGEMIDVTVGFINYLADAPVLDVTLSTPDPFTSLISTQQDIGPIGSGQSDEATFTIQVSQQIPIHHEIRFYLDLVGTAYSDRDVFSLVANPSRAIDHDTGTVQTSLTTEGNIGALGFVGETGGVGFIHNGSNYLFEGGLMIGTGEMTLSDCIRGLDSVQDSDFRPASGTDLVITTPGIVANEEGSVILVDSLAARPLGITIEQESFADDAPENQDFVIFRYTITNDNPTPLEGLYVGLFFDWDIGSAANNWSDFDEVRKMGYVADILPGSANMVATRLLSSASGVSYKAVDNIDELFEDGFTNQEKWSFLSGGIQTRALSGRDVSQLTSEGPFTIESGASIQVAFAIIGANDLAELNASADQAAIYYGALPTSVESDVTLPSSLVTLSQPFPNPFLSTTSVSLSLSSPSNIDVLVYDTLGRRIAQLAGSVFPIGIHDIVWDGRNSNGQRVAPGVYFLRLTANNAIQTRSVIITR